MGLIKSIFEKKGHKFRILHNVVALTLSQGVNTIGQLATVPLFLYFWGKELYGEWLLLSTIPAYFAMNDVGFSGAAATEMTVLVARNERAAALEVFQSIWMLISATSLLLLLGLAAVLTFVPFEDWLNITQLSHHQSVLITLVLLCQVAVSQQVGLLLAGFRCEGVVAVGVNWTNVSRLVEVLFTAAGVAWGSSPLMLAVGILVIRLAGAALMRAHLYRICPWLCFGWQHVRFAQIRRLAVPAFAFMAFPLGHALRNQGIVLIIGRFVGPVGVVVFSTARTLTNVVFQLMGIIHLSVWPEMSAAFGAGDLHLAKGLHRHSCRASFWLSLASVVGLFFLGGWIYRVWTHGNIELHQPLFCVLLIVIVANSLWYTSSMVPMAINRHQRTALWYLLGTGMSLLLAIWMLPHWGLVGAGSALLVVDLVMILHVLPQSLALVQDRFLEFISVVIKPPYRLAWRQ